MKPPIVEILKRGKVRWRVNLGKRITGDSSYHRRFFKTKKAAEQFYSRVTKDITHYGEAFAMLSESVRAGLGKFYGLLQAKNLSLEAVVQLIEKHQATSLTVLGAIEEFYSECEERELDAKTMREYRSHLDRFRKSLGEHPLGALTKRDIEAWLKKIKVRGKTRNNYITTLRTFCEFCIRGEILDKNIAKLVPKSRVYAKTPIILDVEDALKFANYIYVHEPRLVAPFAIALFAGVRTCELEKLLWSDIDFVERRVHIRLEISKRPNQRERWIKMDDNLFAWLSVCEEREGKILKYPTLDNFWGRRSKAFERATGKKWPRNGARKSFGSLHWAFGGDVKQTSKDMGNSPQIAKKFYIAAIEEEKGRQFRQVLPESKDVPAKPKVGAGEGGSFC